MIRIGVTEQHLFSIIDASSKGWMKKKTKNWSDVKPAYLALQSSLCAYCEGGRDYIRSEAGEPEQLPQEKDGEFAVEHFRPKGATATWPDPFSIERLTQIGIDLNSISLGRSRGYGNLRYAPWNYVVSCYTCNSTLKGNRFPIAGKPATRLGKATRSGIAALNAAEQPLLLYPLGDLDEDPETLIQWEGVMPRPRPGLDAARRTRAHATIVFFRLDGVGRPALLEARYKQLAALAFTLQNGGDPTLVLETEPFRGCMRAFKGLYDKSPKVATSLVVLANTELEVLRKARVALARAAAQGKLEAAKKSKRKAKSRKNARRSRKATKKKKVTKASRRTTGARKMATRS